MKQFYAFLLFTACMAVQQTQAQQTEKPVRFANGNLWLGNNITLNTLLPGSLTPALHNNEYFVVVQFATLPTAQQQQALTNQGLRLVHYLPDNAFLATAPATLNFIQLGRYGLSAVAPLPASSKIGTELNRFGNSKDEPYLMAVYLYGGSYQPAAVNALRMMGAKLGSYRMTRPDVVFVQPDTALIKRIAKLPYVCHIGLQVTKDRVLNYPSIGAHAVSALQAPNGRGLLGRGITVGIGDDANIDTHLDFTNRLINRVAYYPNDHGTHVSGTTAGAGLLNPQHRGMAPKATIVSQFFSDVIFNTPTYIADYNMVLTNNSYYTGEYSCPGNSVYDLTSNYADAQSRSYNQLLHVVAAGNDGSFSCAGYPNSYATIKSGWQCAKDVLTVGAAKVDDYSISFFSSRGPTQDGRLKPEIVANGWAVLSTYTNNSYNYYYGTSMAAPNVTGALALLYERYRQLYEGANPPGALVKALACNTAEDLGNAGPDYTFGFGLLNARRAVAALEENRFFSGSVNTSGTGNHNITVPAGTRRLKVLLYWADVPALPGAASMLVNDIDLTVTGPGSTLYQPMILNSTPAGVTNVAVPGIDRINNIEQVVIENPPAGNYDLKATGYAIPQGPQPYYITYEIVNPGITIEYPSSGEAWTPGTPETLRWTAYGNEANSFTVEYSADNGSTWAVLDNNVNAAARSYYWVAGAPAATNQARIRVSRNSTSMSSTSSNYIVLGQPGAVNATNVCEGAVQLNWNGVTGADQYEVLLLTADSMRIIGNTAAANMVVYGLDKDKKSWLAVQARNGAATGRRSLAVSVTPNSGPCLLPGFDNDIKADAILEPVTARMFTNTTANSEKPIKLRIKNLDDATISGSMDVSYSINGGAAVTETISPSIAAGGTYIHTFAQHPLPGGAFNPFVMNLKVWVTRSSDGNRLNDTAYATIKKLSNAVIATLPFTEDFETTDPGTYTSGAMGIEGNDRIDFVSTTNRGRLRSFVNSGFARSGVKGLTADQTPNIGLYNTDSITATYNMTHYSIASNQLRFDFHYKNHGQEVRPGNKVWIRGSENSPWLLAYDLAANQNGINQWKDVHLNLNDILLGALHPQAFSSTFQVRFGQEGMTSANSVVQEQDFDDGYTFDDVVIQRAVNDVGLNGIVSPDKTGCGLGASTPVTITVKNYAGTTLNNIAVSYRINGGAVVTENIATLNNNQTLNYTFNTRANLSAFIDYNIDFWINYNTDSYQGNDSVLQYSFHNSPVVSSFPYLEGFENNDGNWYTKGNYTSWQWGSPAKTTINKAANGTKAWVTGLSGNYKNNEQGYLYSPCFNLTGLTQPVLSFSHIYKIEDNCPCDYTWAEFSTDGGLIWQKLGSVGAGTNWHNDFGTNNWQTSFSNWHVASIDVPVSTVTASNVRFRFVMFADGGLTMEGVGIDDIHVFDKAAIYNGPPITSGLTQTVNSNNWVHFTDGTGKRIASVNSRGQNLGQTAVKVFTNSSGVLRNSNSQYYADRNIVVQPTIAPASPVAIRLYFTDAEAKELALAIYCSTCPRVTDPYQLGVTQYSGLEPEEDGDLDNNVAGAYKYITAANTEIIPYDNGYYAEYEVSDFSEFWLSRGILTPTPTSTCPGDSTIFTVAPGAATYQWQEDAGSGFVNIANGANYAGVATNVLKIVNLPTNATGNRYRCIINGVANSPVTLRFNKVWRGTVNTDWANPGNWGCGIVPDQYTDVTIPGGLTNYPVINSNTAVRTLQTKGGATVQVSTGAALDIKGK